MIILRKQHETEKEKNKKQIIKKQQVVKDAARHDEINIKMTTGRYPA